MVRAQEEIRYVVEGGQSLSGALTVNGNKNGALPIIAASLLTDQPVYLENVPRIRDTEVLVELIASMGVAAEWTAQNALTLCAETLNPDRMDTSLAPNIRASILLLGPLTARCGAVEVPMPGGDRIGRRRADTHFIGLQQLGASYEVGQTYKVTAPQGLVGADVYLDEPSVTGTENVLCAATLASGKTIIHNAACEPHVQDLAKFLIALGADISGAGSNQITVTGTRSLGSARHRIEADHIETASFIGLAAVTNSELLLKDAGVDHLRAILYNFSKLGIECEIQGRDLLIKPDQSLEIRDDIGGHLPKIEDQPWPAFPADAMSIAIVTATQCSGLIMMFEKMFESRMFFVDKLISMGAKIVLCDPHRVLVSGPTPLRPATVSSPDIRAGMALLIAAMCAEGETVIGNARQIERGYEQLYNRLNAVGASIRREAL